MKVTSPAAPHRPPRDFVIRMARQSRIVDPLDPRMGGEELGHGLAVGVVPLHAKVERLQAAEQQILGERRVGRAQIAAELPQRVELRLRAGDGAGQHVVVAGQILGAGVQHVIYAGLQRANVVGRGDGGVNGRLNAMLSSQGSEARRSMTLNCGLVWRFAKQEPRGRRDGRLHLVEVARAYDAGDDAEAACPFSQSSRVR